MSDHICQFCNNVYKTMSSLRYHQKTTKFCLQLQNKELKEEEKFICNFCTRDFTLKQTYNNHVLICKEKKAVEEKDTQQSMKELKQEIQELKQEKQKLKEEFQTEKQKLKEDLKQEIQKLKEEISNCHLTIKFKDEQIAKLEKTNNELISRPTSTTQTIYDNRKTQYNIQFNQLFDKLDILNEYNVNKRINIMSEENQLREYDFGNFIPGFSKNLINVLKDLSFCTDKSRKIVVIKDENSNSIKMSVEEMLGKCLELGTESIRNHFTLTEQIVDDKINNNDETLTSEMLDKFESDINQLKEFILENGGSINLKGENNPLKNFTIPFLKTLEQIYKVPQLKN